MKQIAAVVVTYNRKILLKECIDALLKQTKKDLLDILIIDNDSTDGTREYIDDYIVRGEIQYINTGANLGGAGGFNFGIRYAAEKKYQYVWVMDDDCIALKNTLEEFVIAKESLGEKIGFLSSKVLWKDRKICTMNVQRKTMFTKVRDFDSKLSKITLASFVSLFIPMKIVEEVGLPIKEFFIWTDDWEYTRRISKMYPCYLVNNSIVVHKSTSNIGANISNDSIDRLNRYYYLYRNDVYLYKREGIKGFFYECLRLMLHLSRVIFAGKNHKIMRLKYIFRGTYDGFKFNPEIEYVGENKK